MKGSFSIKRLKDIVRNAKIGTSGFVLVNPQSSVEDGTSFLTENYFIFTSGLIYFKTIDQAKEYRKCLDAEYLFIIGIKRIGKEFNEKGFTLDLTADPNFRKIGWNLSILPKKDLNLYTSNGKYIVFHKPKMVDKPFSIEEYLHELKVKIEYGDAKDFSENQYDYIMICKDPKKIKILGDTSLEYSLFKSIEDEKYELTKKIQKEISERKNKY